MIARDLHTGHLSVRVGDGSRRSEEIVKKISNCAFNAIIIMMIGRGGQHTVYLLTNVTTDWYVGNTLFTC